jgi:periplasmic protein TonB
MKNIFLLITLFIATNSFAQEIKNIPPAEPQEKVEEELFQKVEVEAEFPGGQKEWVKFLQKNLNANAPSDKAAKAGTYIVIVRFIVGKDGTLRDIVIEKNPGYGTGEEVLKTMRKSPKWKPGMQNGVTVSSVKRQPITFVVL